MAWAGANLCAIARQVNLYASASEKSKITWTVGMNMPLKKVSEKKGWFQVKDIDGETHWVQSSKVSSRSSCLAIRMKKTKLRTGPGMNYPEADAPIADRYTPFKDLDGEDGWTRVEDDFGNKGWVNLSHTWKATDTIRMDF